MDDKRNFSFHDQYLKLHDSPKSSNKNQLEQCFCFVYYNPKELLDNKWVDEEF